MALTKNVGEFFSLKLRKTGWNCGEFVIICMTKTSRTNADDLRKELVRSERRIYLEGKDKSYTWDEVKEMAHCKGRLPGMTVDQEVELYLPLLSDQQKWIVLALAKAFILQQNSPIGKAYIESKEKLSKQSQPTKSQSSIASNSSK